MGSLDVLGEDLTHRVDGWLALYFFVYEEIFSHCFLTIESLPMVIEHFLHCLSSRDLSIIIGLGDRRLLLYIAELNFFQFPSFLNDFLHMVLCSFVLFFVELVESNKVHGHGVAELVSFPVVFSE